jgi:hypothetical protein
MARCFAMPAREKNPKHLLHINSRKQMPKKKKYIIRDVNGLNLHFYKRYDEHFLMNKAKTLMFIIEEKDSFMSFVKEIDGMNEDLNDKYFEALRAEIHFTELHQFEGLFALMMAIFQELPHWLYLTTYTTSDIKNKIKLFIDGDIKTLTNGAMKDLQIFTSRSIYADFVSSKESHKEKWNENLDNIHWVVKKIAKKYLQSTEYNAYKHGLRVMTGRSAFVLHPDNQPEKAVCLSHSEDSLSFLELKDEGEGGLTVREVTKHFSPDESFNHLFIMHSLLQTIKTTRLARIKQESGAHINTLFELDKEKLMELGKSTSWRFTV